MNLRRCPVQLCKHRMPRHLFCCHDCWRALPTWLCNAIRQERDLCRLDGAAHSQKLQELRDQAVKILSDRNRERFAKPQGEQLALI